MQGKSSNGFHVDDDDDDDNDDDDYYFRPVGPPEGYKDVLS
jgi:hypothetical protein